MKIKHEVYGEFETTGEFRPAKEGEYYLRCSNTDWQVNRATLSYTGLEMPILRRVVNTYSIDTGYGEWVAKHEHYLSAKVHIKRTCTATLTDVSEADLEYMRTHGANVVARQAVKDNV